MNTRTDNGSLLTRLGLRTSEQRAWAMYDWANSAMVTVIVASVFPIFFSTYAAAGLTAESATFRYSLFTSIGLAIIALLAPFLGAIADHSAIKKQMLGSFLAIGVAAVGMMYFIGQGDWVFAAILFVLANIGANGSFVFYDSLLPHVAGPDEIDRVSTSGYALGYIGGGLLLAGALLLMLNPGWFGLPAGDGLSPEQSSLPARISFVGVAAWWAFFSIPLFRTVHEPDSNRADTHDSGLPVWRVALSRLSRTFHNLRCYRNAFIMLLAFLVYNDGIGTIIRMAVIYGSEIGIGRGALIGAILMVQFVGIPFAFLSGILARRIGAKRAILAGIGVYCMISILGYFMTSAFHFFLLAGLVGMVQGGTQALSRSLFGSMIPPRRSAEYFGFFAVCEKFAGIFGPAVFALMIAVTGSSRSAILSVIAFFAAGAVLLLMVDVEEGQRAAADAEHPPPG